jgi:hypothetical protein
MRDFIIGFVYGSDLRSVLVGRISAPSIEKALNDFLDRQAERQSSVTIPIWIAYLPAEDGLCYFCQKTEYVQFYPRYRVAGDYRLPR